MPYGSMTGNNAGDTDIRFKIDGAEVHEKLTAEVVNSPKKSKESKGKKRKVEGDSPKKSKKAKTDL